MKESYVYKIESPSGKYYIGSTNNLQRRISEHIKGSKNPHSLYIQNAAQKYGADKLKISILATCYTRKEAYILEEEYLKEHFNDDFCMNVGQCAVGFNSETGKKAGDHPNRFDIAAYMKANPNKKVKPYQAKLKKKKEKIQPKNRQEAEIVLTTREFAEWCKNNREDAYALKNLNNEIVYVKRHGLQQFCKDNKLNYSHLYSRRYSKGWYFTKDVSEKGIEELKKREPKINKGNSKQVEIYYDGEYLETVTNLTQWCKDNNISYNTARNIAVGLRKTEYKKYNFKYLNET